jgi:hypothetical protein
MKRLVPALLIVLALSSCAVGVRHAATDVTGSGATLNGTVLSTTGGPGSYFVEYSELLASENPSTERTATRSIDFVAAESHPVSEPVQGLAPGRSHFYRVCAEDGENPGDPFCSPFQRFRTVGDSVVGTGIDCCIGEDLQASWEFDVGSGPSGEDPGGLYIQRAYSGRQLVGVATCLAVSGNRAVVGIHSSDPQIGEFDEYRVVVDGGASGEDRMGNLPSTGPATDCEGVPDTVPLAEFTQSSSIVVTDVQPELAARG